MWAFFGPGASAQLRAEIDTILTDAYPEIKVIFSASRDGQFIRGFSPSDLAVFEDGANRPCEFLYCDSTQEGSAVSVLLILDRSGSMAGQPLADAIDAAVDFVGLMRAGDEIGVIAFDTWIQTISPFTQDKSAVTAAIRGIRLGDLTNLWGACMSGLSFIENRPYRKAVVLLTDGFDNPQVPQYSVDDVIAGAKARSIPFYCIGLGEAVDSLNLQSLAAQTGGKYFSSPTSADLAAIYDEIARIIVSRGVCALRYRSELPCLDGMMHAVRLEVAVQGSVATAAGSYRAPRDTATAVPLDASLPGNVVVESGGSFTLPVSIGPLPPNLSFASLEAELACDTAILKLRSLSTTSLTAGYAVDVQPGTAGYRVSAAGTAPVTSGGELLRLLFDAAPTFESRKTRIALRSLFLPNPCLAARGGEAIVTVSGYCERATRRDTAASASPGIAILSAAPNPLRSGARIGIDLAREGWLSARIVDLSGATVRILADGFRRAGTQYFAFDRGSLPPGAYFCIASAGDETVSRKIILLP